MIGRMCRLLNLLCLKSQTLWKYYSLAIKPLKFKSKIKWCSYNFFFEAYLFSELVFVTSHEFARKSSDCLCFFRELTDIAHMKNFIHVRYVDVSGNHLVDLSPLNHLSHLLLLKANKNNLAAIDLESRPYLQVHYVFQCLLL